ncbi:MAG: outer membrane protein assembly factor BamD, partial [Alphaproteobacteria bacterium]
MNRTLLLLPPAQSRSGYSRIRFAVLALVGTLILAGCASNGADDYTIEPPRAAAEILNEGLAALDSGRYRRAIDSFQELDLYYPYSADARRGLILTAVAAYEINDYELAIASAERFLAAFPADPDVDYALFILGESHMRTVPDITRD